MFFFHLYIYFAYRSRKYVLMVVGGHVLLAYRCDSWWWVLLLSETDLAIRHSLCACNGYLCCKQQQFFCNVPSTVVLCSAVIEIKHFKTVVAPSVSVCLHVTGKWAIRQSLVFWSLSRQDFSNRSSEWIEWFKTSTIEALSGLNDWGDETSTIETEWIEWLRRQD